MIDIAASLEASSRQHAEGCVKTWEDLDRYRQVIAATKPDLIIECGTFSGKSALWFARVSGATVITIDVDNNIDPETLTAWEEVSDEEISFLARIARVQLSSTDPETVDVVHWAADAYERVMVVLDSDHSADHVLAEMNAYSDLVTPGCYMVVEDGILRYMPYSERKHYRGDPLDAIEMWLDAFEITTDSIDGPLFSDGLTDWLADRAIEDMHPVSQFPSGWLRRIR